ncbi:MAG: hypothetical protein H6686_08160 [Fibrobacteria bacterium]|nr:hypothetical protein [Fibrobacteria bacterium]
MTILERNIGPHPLLRLQDPLTGSWVEVLPTRGATIHQIALAKEQEAPREILQPMRTAVEVQKQRWAKGAQLAPWPNRIQDAVYEFQGTTYHPFRSFRSQGGHAMHGTVMQETFSRVPPPEGFGLSLELKAEGWQGYPWPLTMSVHLGFLDGGFRMDVHLTNRSTSEAPIGHGWHPYFTLGRDVRECELELPRGIRLGMSERAVPDGSRSRWERFQGPELVGPDFLNDCIEIDPTTPRAITRLRDPRTGEGLEVWQDVEELGYRYVQVFTHPRRHCLAIEPMSCAPNAFQNGLGLRTLAPGETMRLSTGVRRLAV